MDLLLAVAVGFCFAVFFGAGAAVNHALSARGFRKRVTSIVTADDHRAEAERLIHEAINSNDRDFQGYLKSLAYFHFRSADILENGPYKT